MDVEDDGKEFGIEKKTFSLSLKVISISKSFDNF
jgi:hypothetical protein